MAERMARFPGTSATTVAGVREAATWSRVWRRRSRTTTTKEEWDDSVTGHGGEGRANDGNGVDPAAAPWRRSEWRWRRRGCGKFWQPNDVQVKVLRLGFQDTTAGGFIDGSQ
jgi:hypothetical protein